MTDHRDSIGTADTQHPGTWDGRERRTSTHSMPECPVAEEARREVSDLHRLLHGNGHERGVFEQLRTSAKASDDLAQTVFHLETKVDNFDHKLDEALRTAREELRLAKEEALVAKRDRDRQLPMWMHGGFFASAIAVGVFFVVRLWKDVFGR